MFVGLLATAFKDPRLRPQLPALQRSAVWADEPVGPALLRQVRRAGVVVGKLQLELLQRKGAVVSPSEDRLVGHAPQLNQGVRLGERQPPEPQDMVKPELEG